MSQKTISLKALVDKKKNKVIFAESDEDFVDVLFSFLTMPMGTIIRLIGITGSMNNLYASIERIDEHRFRSNAYKTMLRYPRNGVGAHCKRLKMEIAKDELSNYYECNSCTRRVFSGYKNAICSNCGKFMGVIRSSPPELYTPGSGVFVKGTTRFIVTDELHLMPASTEATLATLFKVGVTDASILEECNLNVGVDEVLKLLKCSLTSKMPLTETFLTKSKEDLHQVSYRMKEPASNAKGNKIRIKLIISKSKKLLCYAEAGEDFVDLLFSFLTVPLGYMVKEMEEMDSSISKGCINHLYNSIHNKPDTDQFLKSDEHKTMLISPKPATEFNYKNNAFGIDSFIMSSTEEAPIRVLDFLKSRTNKKATRSGGFMKGPASFTITDDLIIEPISPISGLSVLQKLGVGFDDTEERTVNIGRKEAMRLFVVSFVSEFALTTTFYHYLL